MPALYTLWNTKLEKRWNVGSDDFVLPTIVAIAVRLVGFVLVVGVLVYLYVAPLGCNDLALETPPWLYGTLFATLLLEFAVVINDAIIMSKSCRGRIDHSQEPSPEEQVQFDMYDGPTPRKHRWPDPDSTSPRRPLKFYLFFRFLLFLLEIVLSGLYGYACWSPMITDQILECEKFQGPVYFARGVAVTWWIVIIISCIMWSIFLDPIGICGPGLLDQLDFLDEEEEIIDPSVHRTFKFHRARISSTKIQRRFKTLFCCCLGLARHRERGVALEDAAQVMQSIFNDVDLVGSDLVAGLILLNRDQKRKIRNNECLVSDCKKHIFRQMSTRSEEDLIPEGYDSSGNRSLHQVSHPTFDKELKDYIVLDDLMHFCHYALGVYGWPLYLYENLDCGTGCCGLTACCRLTAKTCGGCYCKRLSKRRANGDVMADNLCFCGFASVQLMSPDQSLRKDDIKHLTFENEYFECPYLLCVDHAMKAVVVCVRGTLSFKDVLTDITVSVKKLTKEDVGDKFNVPGAYVHRGMYRTAKGIRDQLLSPDKPILTNTLGDYEKDHYRLVIVGHSLGAGVASILAILLKDYFPDLICYAYSPPGCVFSFPLVQYSKDFITSVVIGNDMVARLSIRALHYMKREIEALLKKCKKPKHQVIFQPRYCDRLCGMCTREVEDPSVSMVDIEHKLSRDDSDEEETRKPMSLPPRPALNRADSIISWACCGKKHLKAPKKPAVKKVTRRQRVPTFAPGSILHLTVKQKQKPSCLGPCYVLKVTPEWIHSEDLGVIIADRGMIEDHMPTRVMEVLRTYHREVSVQTGLVFTKDVVSAERRKTTNDEIRNLIQKRSYFDLPVRGRLDSDGKSWRRAMQAGEDEPDGAVEGIDEENDERVRVMMDEPVESSAEDELLPSSPDTANRLYKGTAIDIEENQLTHAEQQNELIASNDRDDPEEIELTVERYGGEGYTELAPTETLL